MMKNGWILSLALAAGIMAGCTGTAEEPQTSPTMSDHMTGGMAGHDMHNMSGEPVEMYSVATDLSSTPQTWFRFRPDTFTAKVGDTLNVTLKAAVGNQYGHSLVIDALKVNLGPATAGATASTEIVLTDAGTYTFYCAEGNHQQLGMQGTLTVS
jgi:plastocyanin